MGSLDVIILNIVVYLLTFVIASSLMFCAKTDKDSGKKGKKDKKGTKESEVTIDKRTELTIDMKTEAKTIGSKSKLTTSSKSRKSSSRKSNSRNSRMSKLSNEDRKSKMSFAPSTGPPLPMNMTEL